MLTLLAAWLVLCLIVFLLAFVAPRLAGFAMWLLISIVAIAACILVSPLEIAARLRRRA